MGDDTTGVVGVVALLVDVVGVGDNDDIMFWELLGVVIS